MEQYRAAASELRYNNIQNQKFYYDYGQIRRKKTPPDKNDMHFGRYMTKTRVSQRTTFTCYMKFLHPSSAQLHVYKIYCMRTHETSSDGT